MNTEQPNQPEPKGPGRPSAYRPEWCAQVVELGRAGKSRCQIAAVLDIDARTLRRLEQRHPEFAEALQRARELAQAWWEDLGQAGCTDRNFNAHGYSLQVRNRFPESWKEKTDLAVSGPEGGPIPLGLTRSLTHDELMRLAAPILEAEIFDAAPAKAPVQLPPAEDAE